MSEEGREARGKRMDGRMNEKGSEYRSERVDGGADGRLKCQPRCWD